MGAIAASLSPDAKSTVEQDKTPTTGTLSSSQPPNDDSKSGAGDDSAASLAPSAVQQSDLSRMSPLELLQHLQFLLAGGGQRSPFALSPTGGLSGGNTQAFDIPNPASGLVDHSPAI
jgi:hypothetical protein